MLRSTALTPKERAICGSAVPITVPSRFSMKNAPATRSAIMSGRRALRDTVSFRLRDIHDQTLRVCCGPQPCDERMAYLSDQTKNVDHLIVIVLLMRRARS